MSAARTSRRQAQRGFLVEEAEREVLVRVADRVAARLLGAVAAVEHAPREAEERLHERRVLVVVAEAAVDGGAREAASAGGRASVLSTRSPYQRPVELGGVEVVAFVARVALGLAAGDERDERDDEDDDGDALVGARGHANHRRASAWKPKLRQAGLAARDVEGDAVARAGERARVDVEAAPAVVVADARAQLLDAVDVDAEVDEAVGRFARVVVVQAGVDDERVAERHLAVAERRRRGDRRARGGRGAGDSRSPWCGARRAGRRRASRSWGRRSSGSIAAEDARVGGAAP